MEKGSVDVVDVDVDVAALLAKFLGCLATPLWLLATPLCLPSRDPCRTSYIDLGASTLWKLLGAGKVREGHVARARSARAT